MVALATQTSKAQSMSDPDVHYDLTLDAEGVPITGPGDLNTPWLNVIEEYINSKDAA